MNNSLQCAQTMNIIDLINLDGIRIPYYQRPYKWTIKNIGELLSDISIAINESKKYVGQDYRYRIGTILLLNKLIVVVEIILRCFVGNRCVE